MITNRGGNNKKTFDSIFLVIFETSFRKLKVIFSGLGGFTDRFSTITDKNIVLSNFRGYFSFIT